MPSIDSDRCATDSTAVSSTFASVMRQMSRQASASNSIRRASDLMEDALRRGADDHPFFLTVVLRTQGRRMEALKDSLLCLASQTREDFEVIVACHKTTPGDREAVGQVVAAQPPSFRDRIQIIDVVDGRRARPLNVALEAAEGRYLSFYDDDDLLFGNWVEAFHDAATREPGKLVRAIVASQRATYEMWPNDSDGFRHLAWPDAVYPAQFDQIAHLTMNFSPFMGWAFPRELFSVLGMRFDEELYVCEDWDMILRGSLSLGVVQADAMTAIYRRWEGVDASHTVHDVTQWQASQLRVIAKLDEQVVLLPAGSVTALRDQSAERAGLLSDRDYLHAVLNSTGFRLAAPLRFAMRVADFGRRATRSVARRVRTRTPAGRS